MDLFHQHPRGIHNKFTIDHGRRPITIFAGRGGKRGGAVKGPVRELRTVGY